MEKKKQWFGENTAVGKYYVRNKWGGKPIEHDMEKIPEVISWSGSTLTTTIGTVFGPVQKARDNHKRGVRIWLFMGGFGMHEPSCESLLLDSWWVLNNGRAAIVLNKIMPGMVLAIQGRRYGYLCTDVRLDGKCSFFNVAEKIEILGTESPEVIQRYVREIQEYDTAGI